MGKDRAARGAQQTRMGQLPTQILGGWSQRKPSGPTGVREPSRAQILAAIEASGQAVQAQITAMAVDVSLLRADLRVVAERSETTEQQVNDIKMDIDTLKATVASLEVKTHKLEATADNAAGGHGGATCESWDSRKARR
ncbi:hypothetical protein NDU88_002374 [Pleurodeles waltl]|uniref:Uncharacterized protein n=1 Tax=Pleurodeles waltl TaxID=8319 RepID=A0AAV7UVD7_PLEWA|nr:hypothetical protein NDU88_002374 [Pleurodeles waltl]